MSNPNPVEKDLGRQKNIEGTEHVRIYHGRIMLAPKWIPVTTANIQEIAHMAFIREQIKLRESMGDSGNHSSIATLDSAPVESKEEHPLVKAILDLPGVEYVLASGYNIIVFKGRQFEWSEIEGHIVRILKTFHLELPDPDHSVIGHGPLHK